MAVILRGARALLVCIPTQLFILLLRPTDGKRGRKGREGRKEGRKEGRRKEADLDSKKGRLLPEGRTDDGRLRSSRPLRSVEASSASARVDSLLLLLLLIREKNEGSTTESYGPIHMRHFYAQSRRQRKGARDRHLQRNTSSGNSRN